MWEQVLHLFWAIFGYCAAWVTQILDATEMTGVYLVMFVILIVTSLVLMPLRTGGVGVAQDVFNPRVWRNKAAAKKRKEEFKKSKKPYSKI